MKAKVKFICGLIVVFAVLGSTLINEGCPCKKKKGATEQVL